MQSCTASFWLCFIESAFVFSSDCSCGCGARVALNMKSYATSSDESNTAERLVGVQCCCEQICPRAAMAESSAGCRTREMPSSCGRDSLQFPHQRMSKGGAVANGATFAGGDRGVQFGNDSDLLQCCNQCMCHCGALEGSSFAFGCLPQAPRERCHYFQRSNVCMCKWGCVAKGLLATCRLNKIRLKADRGQLQYHNQCLRTSRKMGTGSHFACQR